MVKLRAPFSKFKIPAIVYALTIDALDIVPNLIETIVSVTGIGIPFAVGTNLAMDGIQLAISFFVFESPLMWLGASGAEVIIPAPIDIFPTYTALAIAIDRGLIK